MISAFVVFFAVAIDRLIGEFSRWHPLVGFGNYASKIESRFNIAPEHLVQGRVLGGVSLVLLTVPFVVIAYYMASMDVIGFVFEIFVLFIAIGARSLQEHGLKVYAALFDSDIEKARGQVAMIVSRDTTNLTSTEISAATIESILENGCDAIFAAIFWFLIAGAPGVVFYRLVNTLDAMWGYKISQYIYFGWAAARFDDALNYIPARLTALTYALLGKFSIAIACWKTQGSHWKSPNAGLVMASGAGALMVQLGGVATYHGQLQTRPVLGEGNLPAAEDIKRAISLVNRSLIVWVIMTIFILGVLQVA